MQVPVAACQELTTTVPGMADDPKTDPFGNTAAFRAFSAEESEPVRRKPSPMVFWTTIVLLVALVGGVLAFVL